MTSDFTKKRVRILLDHQPQNEIRAEENDMKNNLAQSYSRIPEIKHLKDQNTYSYRPNSDLDTENNIYTEYTYTNSKTNTYEHLDKWKKDLSLKTAQNADELSRMRREHENSLKFDQKFPQLNMEILDAIIRDPNQEQQKKNYFEEKPNNFSIQSLQTLSPRDNNIESFSKKNFTSTIQSMTQLGENANTDRSKSYLQGNNKIYNNAQGKSVKFIQSNDSIQREANKKIVNNLIFSRIQRTLEDNQITARKDADKNEYASSINKQRAEDIFKTEMSHFSNQTLANFKTLMHTFRRSANLIEYEELSRQLSSFLNRPQGIFQSQEQKNQLIDQFKDEKEEKYQFKYMEKVLLENYRQLVSDISHRVNEIKDIRSFCNDLQNQIADLNEKMRLYTLSVEKNIETQEKSVDPTKKQTAVSVTKLKKAIQLLLDEKEKTIQEFKQSKNQLANLINQNQEQLNMNEKDIKTIKEKKNITRNMLKQLYFQTLKNDKQLQKQSLVWIVRALLNINEDITSSELFPSILDRQSIQYLIEYANSESNLDQLMNSIKQKLGDHSMQSENEFFDQKYLHTQHQYNMTELKDKVQKIARKSNLKIRKPIFTTGHGNEYVLAWEHAQDINQHSEIAFSFSKLPMSKVELINSNKDAREEIKQIRIVQKKMKDKEANRLIDLYLVYKDEKKREELKSILHILFGEIEGDDFYKLFQKRYIHLQFQIKNNKTFTFTKSNLTPYFDKEEKVEEKQTPVKGPFGSQVILKYRKGLDEEENKQIDQFALVKQVGKNPTSNSSEQNSLKAHRIQLPKDILERHKYMKKQITEGGQQNNILSSTFFSSYSTTNLDNVDKSKAKSSYNRGNQLFASLNNLTPSLTNLSVDTQSQRESSGQKSFPNNTLYFMTQKNLSITELPSPQKTSMVQQGKFRNYINSQVKLPL